MPTRIITCANCSLNGEIEIYDLKSNVPESKTFKHLGHNPFSGHLHYQCPACEVVLLVDPMDVLGEGTVSGLVGKTDRRRHGYGDDQDMPQAMNILQTIGRCLQAEDYRH